MSVVAVIPAHLGSVRLPRKALLELAGLPMIVHVLRRARLCRNLSAVYVATCDEEIARVVSAEGVKAVMTSTAHKTGTDRVAEAASRIEAEHVIVLQADEALMIPANLDGFAAALSAKPEIPAWNTVGPLGEDELMTPSVVKCLTAPGGRILSCFRKSPCVSPYESQKTFLRKILGLIAYRKEFLVRMSALPQAPFERAESIEQSRILENGFPLQGFEVDRCYPSINEPWEAELTLKILREDPLQKSILEKIAP